MISESNYSPSFLEDNLLADWTKNFEESEIRRLLRYKTRYYFAGGLPGAMPSEILSNILIELGQELKVELIKDFSEDEIISYYTQGEKFFDLCTGPHVERTSHLPKHFKLLHTAGAYWRGNEQRPMLQRIYAASFRDRKELKKHLHFLDEAKKRDHRKLGKDLNLFHFDPVAPGSPFFLPKGGLPIIIKFSLLILTISKGRLSDKKSIFQIC